MDLASHQRKLLGLIKSTYQVTEDEDSYIQQVAQSENLSVIQDIVMFWRSLGIERYCVLTCTLLKRYGLFEQAVEKLIRTQNFSPFIEKLGSDFVAMMSEHENSLIASVAQFELAFIKVRHGDTERYVIDWQYNPYAVLNSLLRNLPVTEDDIRGKYQTVVSFQLPNTFEVLEL